MSEQVPPTGPTLDTDAADDRRELALPSVVLVTGTGTEIGKTIATAALTALVLARGSRVAVLKPAQTGLAPGDAGDVDVVRSLAATPETAARLTTLEPIRVPEPLAKLMLQPAPRRTTPAVPPTPGRPIPRTRWPPGVLPAGPATRRPP